MNLSQYTTIDLLRHGECEGGEIYRGHTDVALTDSGWRQMQESLRLVDPPWPWQRIITSPLQRCQQFTHHLAEEIGIPWETNASFREIHFGDWDGKPVQEVWDSDPEQAQQFILNPAKLSPPNGEKMFDFQQRVLSGWQETISHCHDEHILCVQHGGTIRIILAHILHMPLNAIGRLHVPYAALSRIRVYHDRDNHHPVLIFHNPVTLSP
ncbi:MAG: histidine phosphatase family protein [Pseudomonadales bacterium]|nr:histidine phosphatase family protein [Pseudomonadales bacterium]